jgi:cytochrome b6-f complex iron-sulfur subunit
MNPEGAEPAATPPRRRFIFQSAVVGVAALFAAAGSAIARFLVPNVLYEPPSQFPVGVPDSFPQNSVRFLASMRLFVIHDGAGFAALSAVCTHLGCNVKKGRIGFECPCHGSRYSEAGRVTGGPAPRPLNWYRLILSRRGELIVDTREVVPPEFRLTLA